MSDMPGAAKRPLSPHLQIYRPMLTMMMSIVHRITGCALYFGTLLLVIWLVAAASSTATFDFVNGLFGSWIGLIVLVGYSWAMIHHLLGGLRHFVWDTGAGFGRDTIRTSAYTVLAVTVIATAAFSWLAIL